MAAPTILTSVLTGGSNSHQTTSEEVNAYATDFVSEGIVGSVANTSGVAPATGGFAINASGTPDTNVVISTGVAYVTGTPTSQNSQTLRVKCSVSGTLAISANSSGSTKYDWIYISVSAGNAANPNTAGDNVATIVASRSSSASSDDGTPPTYGYPLAVVTVANGFSTITNSNIRDIRTQTVLNTGSNNAVDGWTPLSSALSVSSGYNKGNREFDITSASDMTGILSPGMRLKVTRATSPPTQCTDLESGSSQFWSKSSPTGLGQTDDITCEAWVKLESYTGSSQTIMSRINGTTDGWTFEINTSGQLVLKGARAADDLITSVQSIPLGRKLHVAAAIDSSGATGTIWIDGVAVSSTFTNNANSAFNTPTANFRIGAGTGGTLFFDGEIAEARYWSAIRTTTQIRDNMSKQLVGNESNLAGYWTFNGNANDSTSNANNLSTNGGAAATTSDSFLNSTEYAIITKVTASTITVFTGTDYTIPNDTLSTPYYSAQRAPFGFPASEIKWYVDVVVKTDNTAVTALATIWAQLDSIQMTGPTGAWAVRGYANVAAERTSGSGMEVALAVSTSTSSPSVDTLANFDTDLSAINYRPSSAGHFGGYIELTASTTVYLIYYTLTTSNVTQLERKGSVVPSFFRLTCGYV